MSVDMYVKVRIPLGAKDERIKKYFESTNYCRYWKPTKEYLNLLCSSEELNEYWHTTKEELFDIYNNFIFELEEYEYNNNYVIFSDIFGLNGGDTVLDPSLISKLFPELDIETEQFTDGDDEEYYCIWKNGEIIKDVKAEDCELGKLRIQEIRIQEREKNYGNYIL